MVKVHFEIPSFEKIAEFIYDLKDTLDKSTLKQRSSLDCIFVELKPKLKKELFYAKGLTSELKEKLVKEIEKKMNSEKEEMIKFLNQIKSKWKEIEKTFFNEMKKFFGFGDDKEFYCYINNCIVSSYFGRNEVSLIYFKEFDNKIEEEKKKKLMIEATSTIAEEILHLLYFDYLRKIFRKNFTFDEVYDMGNENYSGWHLVELMPEYLLTHNPAFKKFGWDKIEREKQGYFWIPKIRKKIDPIYKEKSFKNFIIEIHKPFFS